MFVTGIFLEKGRGKRLGRDTQGDRFRGGRWYPAWKSRGGSVQGRQWILLVIPEVWGGAQYTVVELGAIRRVMGQRPSILDLKMLGGGRLAYR